MTNPLPTTNSAQPSSLIAWADDAWTDLIEQIFHHSWTPLAKLARTAVLSLMARVVRGSLRITTPEDVHQFPAVQGTDALGSCNHLKAELHVIKDVFWLRLFAMADLGFAEAYMYGEVDCDDLVSLFKIFILNRESLSELDSRASYLLRIPQKLTSWRFTNSLSNSRSNISAHYDISNAMFAGFLSEDMTYSCGIFEDLDSDLAVEHSDQHRVAENGGEQPPSSDVHQSSTHPGHSSTIRDELHDAQMRKLNHIIAKARLSSGQRVLEIGSGWGSMAILIAQRFPDTTIDTLTLSAQQQALAQARIKEAGLEDRITVHLMDYRAMPSSWEASFDRVISIEMIENVGMEFLAEYWGVVDWAMKKKDGVGVVQVITIPEHRFERYTREIDFIRKWCVLHILSSLQCANDARIVFPGGVLPSLTVLLRTMEEGSSGRLVVDSVCNIGPHYARTLREWRRRFTDRFETVIVPALKEEHPAVMNGPRGAEEIEVFKRKWLYYYCYCEAGFTTRALGDHIITFTREGYEDYGCDV